MNHAGVSHAPRNPKSTTLIEPAGSTLTATAEVNLTPLTRQGRDGSSQSEIRDHTTEWHAERPLRPGIRAGSVTGPWIIWLVGLLSHYGSYGSVPSCVGGYTREYFEIDLSSTASLAIWGTESN